MADDDQIVLVKEVELSRQVIRIRTSRDFYKFDLSNITEEEFKNVISILKKMNFDDAFKFHFSK